MIRFDPRHLTQIELHGLYRFTNSYSLNVTSFKYEHREAEVEVKIQNMFCCGFKSKVDLLKK